MSAGRRCAGGGVPGTVGHTAAGEPGLLRSSDGTWLHVRTWGPPDGPPVVLVHGLGLSLQSWRDVVGPLADRHHVIAYDLRGHGHSGHARTGDYSLDAHAADLDTVLAHTLVDRRRAVVAGHSLGGAVILARARRRVDRMAGVVFAGSAAAVVTLPGLPARGLPRPARRRLVGTWLGVLRAAARAARLLRSAARLGNVVGRHLVFAPGAAERVVDRARRDFLATDPDVLAACSLAAVRQDGSRSAPSLTVPALVLRGDRDREADRADVRTLLDRLPDGHLVTLRGRGHMLSMTDGAVVAGHIARWVAHVRNR